MRRVLFINFNSIWGPHFETDLEIMLNLKNNGDEIFSLSCGNQFCHFCISNPTQDTKYCKRCLKTLTNGLNLIKLDDEHRLKIDIHYEFTKGSFSSISDLIDFSVDGLNIGLGVTSSMMSLTRDYNFSIDENKQKIDLLLDNAYTIFKALDKYQKMYNFDAVYAFNGRFSEYYSAIEYCEKNDIEFYLHERGSSINKYLLIENKQLHKKSTFEYCIDEEWDKNQLIDKKKEIADKWFHERRDGVEQNWSSFIGNQEKNRLPQNFDRDKENIVIFNSSLDEFAAFKEWTNPIEPNENLLYENIIKHYLNDTNKHFYLRIHPNLNGVNTSQMQELNLLKSKNYQNLTVIMPDESVDTYGLMDACKKTIVSTSTTGLESTYWGNTSIVTGVAIYEKYNCSYITKTYEELYKLIDNPNLLPKSKENTYKYAYWAAEHGIEFKYFEPNGLFHGKFLGVDLKKKPWHVKLRLALQKRFKK